MGRARRDATPVTDPVRIALEKALVAKEIVTIRYHGGSTPGALRAIMPLRVTHTGKLQALDMTTRGVKLMVFASIEFVKDGEPIG